MPFSRDALHRFSHPFMWATTSRGERPLAWAALAFSRRTCHGAFSELSLRRPSMVPALIARRIVLDETPTAAAACLRVTHVGGPPSGNSWPARPPTVPESSAGLPSSCCSLTGAPYSQPSSNVQALHRPSEPITGPAFQPNVNNFLAPGHRTTCHHPPISAHMRNLGRCDSPCQTSPQFPEGGARGVPDGNGSVVGCRVSRL